jgi:hypothetical protein
MKVRDRSKNQRIHVGINPNLNGPKLAELDEVLTPKEAKQVRAGEAQLRQGLYVTLEQLENYMEHKARKISRKAV